MGNSNNDDAYEYTIPNLDESKVKNEYKIGFIGESGTGSKSSLINRLRGTKFGEDLTSSNGFSCSEMKIKLRKNKVTHFYLWGLSSKEKHIQKTKSFLGDIDCAV